MLIYFMLPPEATILNKLLVRLRYIIYTFKIVNKLKLKIIHCLNLLTQLVHYIFYFNN